MCDTSSLVQSFLCMMHLLLSNHLYTKGPIYGSLITRNLIDVTLADEDNNSGKHCQRRSVTDPEIDSVTKVIFIEKSATYIRCKFFHQIVALALLQLVANSAIK